MRLAVLLAVISASLVATSTETALAADKPVTILFDTDIQGDVDDVGAVAVLHALADRGEVVILGMGVSALHPACVPCLDALNTYFGRPDLPIGVNKGEGFERDSKYNRQIAEEFPHDLKSADDAPDAALLYRRLLAGQPDRSVVMVSVGQLSNFRTLLETPADEHSALSGVDLVRQKVRAWVVMGGKFPRGREANFYHHADAAVAAIDAWPTPIVFSGFEIGRQIMTGGRLKSLPKSSPVRRAYELYNGVANHFSWDQTAVLYAARGLDGGLDDVWDVHSQGHCRVAADGSNEWRAMPDRQHSYLVEKMPPGGVARLIEDLMLAEPASRLDDATR